MVARYTPATQLHHAKIIAKEAGCFIIEIRPTGYVLYREASPKNQRIGKRATEAGILALVKKACTTK